jgi:hypothetical protein
MLDGKFMYLYLDTPIPYFVVVVGLACLIEPKSHVASSVSHARRINDDRPD